jgi:hypothetical protein
MIRRDLLRRLKREAEREDMLFTVFCLALLVFMLVCLGGAFVIVLTDPPRSIP